VKWIDPLFEAFNAIAPNRAKGQDGTIGDTAHQAETSGHNPDDTAGVKAERQDADSVPEVRAADVDADLRQPGVTMEQAVQAVLHGPAAERDRLIYIIYNRRIWRKSNGWRQETYTGSDPHDRHAHFSGDPESDEDARAWTSIKNIGAGMEQTEPLNPANAEGNTVGNALNIATQVRTGAWLDDAKTGYGRPAPNSAFGRIYAGLAALLAKVEAIQAGQVSQDAVNAAVLAALQTPEVRATLIDAARQGAELAEDS
jgi:hypothetical protein